MSSVADHNLGLPTRARGLMYEAKQNSGALNCCARQIAHNIVRGCTTREEHVYSCTFTLPSGEYDDLLTKLRRYAVVLESTGKGGAVFLVPECSDEGRHHAHGFVLSALTASKVANIWLKLWPAPARPNRQAISIKQLRGRSDHAVCHASDLRRVVRYSLKCRAHDGVVSFADVVTSDCVEAVWAAGIPSRVATHLPSVAPVVALPLAGKPPTTGSRPLRIKVGEQCLWCKRSLAGMRSDAVWCGKSCRNQGNRVRHQVLSEVTAHAAKELDEIIDVLEADFGFSRRDALIEAPEWLGLGVPNMPALLAIAAPKLPTCPVCEQPKQSRVNSTTCGNPGCESQHRRALAARRRNR